MINFPGGTKGLVVTRRTMSGITIYSEKHCPSSDSNFLHSRVHSLQEGKNNRLPFTCSFCHLQQRRKGSITLQIGDNELAETVPRHQSQEILGSKRPKSKPCITLFLHISYFIFSRLRLSIFFLITFFSKKNT